MHRALPHDLVHQLITINFVLLLFLCGIHSLSAQFIDISTMLGVSNVPQYSPHGHGVSFYDFNNDGWDDLTLSAGVNTPLFFVNNNGILEPADFSVPNASGGNISMMLWADYDNDGDADLLITKFGGGLELWKNDGDFNFTEVAAISGLQTGNFEHVGAAFCDYNHDGYLDLYVSKFYHPTYWSGPNYTGKLYMNNGDGTFTDVTVEAGVYIPVRPTFQPVFLDFDGDGWEDLLLVIDRQHWSNELFKNNGDGTFTNVTDTSGFGFAFDAMTGTVGDFDNDADLDIYLTNNPYYDFGTVLMQNNGDETFTNVGQEMGVALFEVTWGALWLDYDNDSWQDLFVSVTSPVLDPIGNQFYVNHQGTSFTQENELLGIADDPSQTYVCAMGDINNDGYFDFAFNCKSPYSSRVYLNTGGENNYISVSLEGTISNKDGIGSWIHCYANGEHYVRFTLCGENLISQNSRKVIFGLGTIESVDSLVIEWNRGIRDVYHNPPINSHLHIVEGMTQTEAFLLTASSNSILCPGDTIVLNAGEFAEYTWSTGDHSQHLYVTEPGIYWVEVINAYGNATASMPISIDPAPTPEIIWSVDDVSCFGMQDGSVWVEASTGPLTDYNWSNGEETPFISELSPGIYSFTAFDSYGCFVTDSTEVIQPDSISVIPFITPVACYGEQTGQVFLNISGGTPPYYPNWLGYNPSALAAGSYNVLVTDWGNCSVLSTVLVPQPDSLHLELVIEPAASMDVGGNASIEILGGTPPYNILWSSGVQNEWSLTDLVAGNYWVEVIDDNNCAIDHSFSIEKVSGISQHFTPEIVVYPNPCHEILFLKNCYHDVNYKILDMTGKTVMHLDNHYCGSGIPVAQLESGTYVLRDEKNNQVYLFTKTNKL